MYLAASGLSCGTRGLHVLMQDLLCAGSAVVVHSLIAPGHVGS